VKSPTVFVRDSGLVHALLNIADHEALPGHPVAGASREGFVIENLILTASAPGPVRKAGLLAKILSGLTRTGSATRAEARHVCLGNVPTIIICSGK
jgi:hypothetical protein